MFLWHCSKYCIGFCSSLHRFINSSCSFHQSKKWHEGQIFEIHSIFFNHAMKATTQTDPQLLDGSNLVLFHETLWKPEKATLEAEWIGYLQINTHLKSSVVRTRMSTSINGMQNINKISIYRQVISKRVKWDISIKSTIVVQLSQPDLYFSRQEGPHFLP